MGEAGFRRKVRQLTATQTPAMIAQTAMLSLNASVNACLRSSALRELERPAGVVRSARSFGVTVPPSSRCSTAPLMAAEAASPKAPPKDRNCAIMPWAMAIYGQWSGCKIGEANRVGHVTYQHLSF